MNKKPKIKLMSICMLNLFFLLGAIFSLSGCSSGAQQTANVPLNTMLPYHEEYEKMDNPTTTTISWDGTPHSLARMRTDKEYGFLAEVQIGRYQRSYANGELDGISIFTATVTKVLDVVDAKNTPKVGTVIFLVQGSTPKCAYEMDPLYVEGEKYVLPLHLCGEPFYELTDNAMSEELHTVRQDYPMLYKANGGGVDTLRVADIDGEEYVLVMGFGEKLIPDKPDEHFLAGLELKLADDELTERILLKLYGNSNGLKHKSAYSYDAFISAIDALK